MKEYLLQRIEEEISYKPELSDYDVSFTDLGLDSLDLTSLIFDFQQEFDVDIESDEYTQIDTINSLFKIVEKIEADKSFK
jgi:acyl carrier protein